jgi:hypothetical protein
VLDGDASNATAKSMDVQANLPILESDAATLRTKADDARRAWEKIQK